ncbi:hypothetical protein [Methanobrevibacter sp.]|jgi:hypothetical protein|uniref:hypothetical protein n=1 Tax=Methanobrevibacter sp. TaxID=66852 RepID=UPI003867DC81
MPKYYSYDKIWNRYRIARKINGKRVSYGTYASEEEAQQVVLELEKVDWDRTQLQSIRDNLGIKSQRQV